jgi:hypothetical protein
MNVQQKIETTGKESRQVEPVAWMDIDSEGNRLNVRQWSDGNSQEVPLYMALPQQVQEPVAWISYESLGRLKNGGNSRGAVPVHTIQSYTAKIPLYTAPPQRKPLTDEEIDALELLLSGTATVRDFARVIERAHGIGDAALGTVFKDYEVRATDETP